MNWPTSRLGDVASFVRGVSFKPDDVQPLGTEGTIACFRTKNVQSDIDLEDVWAIPLDAVGRADQFLIEGDLLISTANSWNLVGKCCWVPNLSWPATLGGFIAGLRPDRRHVFPRYLYHWIVTERVQAKLRGCARQTTNISNLDLNQAKDLRIPLPSMEEQRRIAAILDKADALRQKRRLALQKLDSLTQSLFLDMFGDPVRNPKGWTIGTIADLVSDPKRDVRCGPFGTQLKVAEITSQGVPLFGIETAVRDEFDSNVKKFVTERKALELKAFEARPGDVLVTRMGTIGRACVVPEHFPISRFSYHLFRIRPDVRKCLPEFLAATISKSGIFMRQLREQAHGAIMDGLSTQDLRSVKFPIPAIERQAEFVRQVKATDRLRQRLESKPLVSDIFACLQHRAFRGEL